ncbi:response regulator [Celeribacter naphthalenivorans]|uniref:response regulator n=1 Tax=Celeribacter naphthalenivorans TaxID=1614694 RepID=UPI001CFBBF36|nr:response regulator [Celeribacter naphthalenivorans]
MVTFSIYGRLYEFITVVAFSILEAYMRILAVDDDPFILELLPMIGQKAGFDKMSTAPSGTAALDILANSEAPFECLLLDINMPGMDGIELCARVREVPSYRKVPIIMLTAMKEREFIDRAFEAGATDYASKPFDIVELRTRLRLAKELIAARQGHLEANDKSSQPTLSCESDTPPPLSDAVTIEGIKNLICEGALENYLKQLSNAGLGGSNIFAVKIHQIEAIHSRASMAEFSYALTEVTDAIFNALGATKPLMSYVGNGAFIVVSNTPHFETSEKLESEIQNALDEKNSEYDNGEPLDLEVSAGSPLRPNTSAMLSVRDTFERAIARAQARVEEKQKAPRPVNIYSAYSV